MAFVFAVGAAACSRTPPEPTPTPTSIRPESQATTSAAGTGSGSSSSARANENEKRCIKELPQTAPVIPPPADSSRCPVDPEIETKMAMGEVGFPDAPSQPRIEVELAKSEHDVEKGLMYRRTMSDEHGMLFKLDGRREHQFWMHNTCIPLDMLFIDDDGVIVGIVEGAAPITDSTRTVGCPSVFVLEVNGGWTRKRGVMPGQKMTIPFSAR